MTPTYPNNNNKNKNSNNNKNNNEDYSFSLSAVVHDTPSHAVLSADGLDSILAKELYGMSVQDRDITQEEIHGIRSVAQEETPEMTDKAFGSFQKEIEKIPTKPAYNMAVATNSHYVLHDRDFRIRFLRADFFDTKKAAARFINHLDLLLDYYGPIALHRPLRYSDLGKDVQGVIRMGSIQILPSRDRADRLIVFYHRSMVGLPIRTRLQGFIYLLSVVSEDVETQRRGLVWLFSTDVALDRRRPKTDMDSAYDAMRKFFKAWPVRVCCHHFSFPESPSLNLLRAWIMFVVFDKEQRARVKFYKGVWNTETRYELISYGIPANELPMTSTGAMKLKNHMQWIKTRKAIDDVRQCQEAYIQQQLQQQQYVPPFTPTTHPRINDVLFRHGGNKGWQGNMNFRDLVESNADRYNHALNVTMRRQTRQDIIDGVTQGPKYGCFLELHPGGWWVEITDLDVIDSKVTVALHERNRNLAATKNRQDTRSDTMKFSGMDGTKRRRIDGSNIEDDFCGGDCF